MNETCHSDVLLNQGENSHETVENAYFHPWFNNRLAIGELNVLREH